MANKIRGRKPRLLEVTNREPLGASIPDWERELLRSALKRLELEPHATQGRRAMAARREPGRTAWVSYLRVSTDRQADRQLSIPEQRHAVLTCATAHGAVVAREYVEEGFSG